MRKAHTGDHARMPLKQGNWRTRHPGEKTPAVKRAVPIRNLTKQLRW